MKIIPLAMLMLFTLLQPLSPTNAKSFVIFKDRPIVTLEPLIIAYKPLIDAIYIVESGRNPKAYNEKEDAVGGLQIRPCRLDHYNKLTGKNYVLDDMYDLNKAIEVFLYFCNHNNKGELIKRKPFEVAARNWNGRWDLTVGYWEKVKRLLYS